MDGNRLKLKQEPKTKQINFLCEPGICACGPTFVSNPNVIQYQSIDDCVNDNNCCKKWKCDPNGLGVCEAVDDINAPFDTEQDCLAVNPNGCANSGPETCCTVWVCVGRGSNSECCKSLELCKPLGGPWGTNYPGGFPWNLVESSGVPQKDFNKILKQNLLLEWMCNMDWSAHFGIWLSNSKQGCLNGPGYQGVGPASGTPPCGPCMVSPDLDKGFEVDYSGDEAISMIDKWKKEGRVRKLDESFYTDIISLVEDIYHTKNLLKG
tara:strand:- start:1521 stop:2315 length:795 start_codon:yes stop_codon:yes gene_type:complete